MFTGIVSAVEPIVKTSSEKSFFVWIRKPKTWDISEGESILVDGVCSTVRKVSATNFEVEYMPETVAKTTVGNFSKGKKVHVEESLRMGEKIGGHIVQGHIDAVGRITKIVKDHMSKILTITLPRHLSRYIVSKGSIAVDGVSLTVTATGKGWFSVALIDYTLKNTIFGEMKVGDQVNVETDVMAKYVERQRGNGKR